MQKLFHKLEDLLVAENLQWWDTTFLQKYLELKLTPRGLRITQWIKVIIKQREIRLAKHKSQIDQVTDLILQHQSFCFLDRWFDNLIRKIRAKEKMMVHKKISKLNRHLADYQLDRVHTWPSDKRKKTISSYIV